MSVRIAIAPTLSHLTGNLNYVEVDGRNVGQCLNALAGRFPKIREHLFGSDGRLEKNIEVYVNLRSTYPEELRTAVADGDEIQIVEMVAGG